MAEASSLRSSATNCADRTDVVASLERRKEAPLQAMDRTASKLGFRAVGDIGVRLAPRVVEPVVPSTVYAATCWVLHPVGGLLNLFRARQLA